MIKSYFMFIAFQFSLDWTVLYSICSVESDFPSKGIANANVITRNDGHGDSVGICQIKLKTARWIADNPMLDDIALLQPQVNIYHAAMYLAWQFERYPWNVRCAISAYNGHRCLKSNQKTYVDKVLQRQKELINEEG